MKNKMTRRQQEDKHISAALSEHVFGTAESDIDEHDIRRVREWLGKIDFIDIPKLELAKLIDAQWL